MRKIISVLILLSMLLTIASPAWAQDAPPTGDTPDASDAAKARILLPFVGNDSAPTAPVQDSAPTQEPAPTAEPEDTGMPNMAPISSAAATVATDETKVPHYFGPYPNWANSPFTLADAQVTITDSGAGAGAEAVANVGIDGSITSISVTNPGHDYTNATVTITGAGSGAAASAAVVQNGSVVAVNVTQPGKGYIAPTVSFNGGNANGTPASGTVFGGVATVDLVTPGDGYSFPTVDFDLPDAPDGVVAKAHIVCQETDCIPAAGASFVTITGIVVDDPGSGYSTAPNVVIRNGTLFDPIARDPATFVDATATTSLGIQSVVLDSFGTGYTSAPNVVFNDATGTGAAATAAIDTSIISSIKVDAAGSGYITPGGIKKFQDGLPQLCNPSVAGQCASLANNLGQYMPLAVADTTTFGGNATTPAADYYVIAVVQHREQMHSSLAPTLLREYVQLETATNASWSKHVALQNDMLTGPSVPALLPNGQQAYAVDNPHYLGPVIAATKDRPVRIVFYDLLPTGAKGDLFLPTDSSMMGSGMGPMAMMDPMNDGTVIDEVRNPTCTEAPKSSGCFKDNRATLHLHGGVTPWISDGTPHQWITPANEQTPWPQGVSVKEVPDMAGVPGVPSCTGAGDGCQTFYYTNQQSARLMFYHDHAWGITRLNVYAGEAAGYVIGDPTEQKLINSNIIPTAMIPLIIQDRTFVPSDAQLYGDKANGIYGQDPTWDKTRWGGAGNLWYHHVYMPAQNPGDPSGMSAYGRWMYGPWFWPPATPKYGPIANPYYDPKCNLDNPATWQYQVDPFCEPQLIPGTPNISVGMEQFNDTPVVNGTAYPTTNVDPKPYRLRILNAANDRFWNLQWYVADATGTEVALNAAELAAAQLDPNIFPTPDTSVSPAGPSWIQIGTEGGFLPAPVVVPNQPITWITDPTRFDVGNVDKHSLLLAPAERADVIVDFSKFAGKTLILYNDAPAAFPARVAGYDYYTGDPDMTPAGAPSTLPGYGPNTRTIMQVKVGSTGKVAFNLTALTNAFKHKADGSGVFEAGQHPIIVGQAAYNSAYGTSFVSSSWCNSPSAAATTRCDGYARISEQGGSAFKFNTLKNPTTQKQIVLQPKAIHDEMNAATFDEFGRMTANLGVEAVPATAAGQSIVLYPYVNPSTELIDATNLPKGDVGVTPVGLADDGSQIWKITHNGVDTHPIHFHLYDVQVLNRVTWDNIIIPPDATELGWKDTVRTSPLEDTIVALRPIIPTLPFELPNSIRPLDPMMLTNQPAPSFNNVDQNGIPTAPIVNKLVNFGWEYVYHCHILSHEEMDMMRPVSVALPPNVPTGLVLDPATKKLSWNDNSINETEFLVQRTTDGTNWTDIGTVPSPLDQANTHGVRSIVDATFDINGNYQYRVIARNTIGYGAEFMSMTVQSVSQALAYAPQPPPAPTNLVATYQATLRAVLTWGNTPNETGFVVQRSADGVNFTNLVTLGQNVTTYTDTTLAFDGRYSYRVYAFNGGGNSPMSNVAVITTPPTTPSALAATYQAGPPQSVRLTWTDNSVTETSQRVWRCTGAVCTNYAQIVSLPSATPPNSKAAATYTDATVARNTTYRYVVTAVNAANQASNTSNVATVTVPDLPPAAPSNVRVTAARQGANNERITVTWNDNSNNETGFVVQWANNSNFNNATQITTNANVRTYTSGNIARGSYYVRVAATNAGGQSAWVTATPLPVAAP